MENQYFFLIITSIINNMMEYYILINVYRNAIPKVIPWGNWRFRVIQPNLKKKTKKKHCKWFELPSWYFRFTITIIIIKKPIKAMYYTVIKHSRHLRTLKKCRKHSPAAPVSYISFVCSNACLVLSLCNTRFRLLYLFNMWLCMCICKYIGSN